MVWRTFNLGQVCEVVKGTSSALNEAPGQYPLVVTAAKRKTAQRFQIDGEAVCVPLVSSTGHGNAAINRLHYESGRFAVASILAALIPKTAGLSCKYLFYYLTAKKDDLLVPLMKGTSNVSLTVDKLKSVEIILPDLDRQKSIVEYLDQALGQVRGALSLEAEIEEETRQLLVNLAHRPDLSSSAKKAQGWRQVAFSDFLTEIVDAHAVIPGKQYPNLGIYSYAKGAFKKPPIDGSQTSAKTLYKVQSGDFIYSRLFAFEGAYALVPSELDGVYVSNEFPSFSINKGTATAEFLAAYFLSSKVWAELAGGSMGLGSRRQRINQSHFLAQTIVLPPLAYQQEVAKVTDRLRALSDSGRKETLEALLPAVLRDIFSAKRWGIGWLNSNEGGSEVQRPFKEAARMAPKGSKGETGDRVRARRHA